MQIFWSVADLFNEGYIDDSVLKSSTFEINLERRTLNTFSTTSLLLIVLRHPTSKICVTVPVEVSLSNTRIDQFSFAGAMEWIVYPMERKSLQIHTITLP